MGLWRGLTARAGVRARRGATGLAAVVVLGGAARVPATAAAASRTPVITQIRCVPKTTAACAGGVAVPVGRLLQFSGRRLKDGMRVSFRWPAGALATRLRRSHGGYTARVPAGTRPGTVSVTVTDGAGRRSRARRIRVVGSGPTPVPMPVVAGLPGALAGHGMWIWQLPKTEKGNVAAIAQKATASGFATVFVKAADGGDVWPQFTPELVAQLKAAGLRVCAWQYVYGTHPADEAAAALEAIRRGADCFVVDAEGQYEGRYASAQTYMAALRAGAGADYPVALTSFPYTDYHPALPYSVFLGPGGAQVNAPQVYWKDIGGTVDAVSARTLAQNRPYTRPLAPLGQTYQQPTGAELQRFRQVWSSYGAGGLSWWDWQETTPTAFQTLASPAPAPAALPDPGWPLLRKGSKGDQVVWLQQHLVSGDPSVQVTGTYDAATLASVTALQTAHGYAATGTTDPGTWQAILSLPVTPVDWTARAAPRALRAGAASASAPGHSALHPHGMEIPSVGAGGDGG